LALVSLTDRMRFSLSPRERAGVRGNGPYLVPDGISNPAPLKVSRLRQS
jgi:hypothetical protein